MGRGLDETPILRDRQGMRERRRKRRRARRLGKSYNPDPEALSCQTWYHGTPEGGFSIEDIDLTKSERPIKGFYLASLKPVADFYRRAHSFFYQWDLSEEATVYRVRVRVTNPLDQDAAPEDDFLHFLYELKKEIKEDALVTDKKALDFFTEENDYKSNGGALFSFLDDLKHIALGGDGINREISKRARAIEDNFTERLLGAGWDSLTRRMRGGPDEKVTAFHTAEELILLDPKNQIEEMSS